MDITLSPYPSPCVENISPDAISVTANWNGFTTLRGYASDPKWREMLTEEIIEECNQNQEIITIDTINPILFLVPMTRGQGATYKLMANLFAAIDQQNVKILEFTHYACLRGKIPEKEIFEIASFLFSNTLETSLVKLIWRVDPRAEYAIRDIFFQANPNFVEKE
jgi:hypothetical protein